MAELGFDLGSDFTCCGTGDPATILNRLLCGWGAGSISYVLVCVRTSSESSYLLSNSMRASWTAGGAVVDGQVDRQSGWQPPTESPASSLQPPPPPQRSWATGWDHGSGFLILLPFYMQKKVRREEEGSEWTMACLSWSPHPGSEAALYQPCACSPGVWPVGFLVACVWGWKGRITHGLQAVIEKPLQELQGCMAEGHTFQSASGCRDLGVYPQSWKSVYPRRPGIE